MAAFGEVYVEVATGTELHFCAADGAYAYLHDTNPLADIYKRTSVQIIRFEESFELVREKNASNCRECKRLLDDFNGSSRGRK